MYCGEAFSRLGVQGVKCLILAGALFMLDGGRRREENKRNEERKKLLWGSRISLGLDSGHPRTKDRTCRSAS
jgi:hypothetical protein